MYWESPSCTAYIVSQLFLLEKESLDRHLVYTAVAWRHPNRYTPVAYFMRSDHLYIIMGASTPLSVRARAIKCREFFVSFHFFFRLLTEK